MRHALIAAVLLTGCAQAPPSGATPAQQSERTQLAPDSVRLMRTLSVLAHDSMEGRRTGTAGALRAQRFLTAELERRGVKPLHESGYLQTFSVAARGADPVQAANVVGVIRGTQYPDRHIVLSAHFDHMGSRNGDVMNGADDNASGVAGVLEIASWFAAHPPQHSIVIALFDAEEVGLRGARHFVDSGAAGGRAGILLNINLDMVGRNARNELYAAGTARYPALLPYVQAAAQRSGLKLLTGHDVEGTGREDWTMQSDQGAFHGAGIPFLYFGVEDHPDYHQPTDEITGIMPGFYLNAIRSVLDVVRQIDARPPA